MMHNLRGFAPQPHPYAWNVRALARRANISSSGCKSRQGGRGIPTVVNLPDIKGNAGWVYLCPVQM